MSDNHFVITNILFKNRKRREIENLENLPYIEQKRGELNLGLCSPLWGDIKCWVYSGYQISDNKYPFQTEHVLDIKLGAEPWSALTFVCVCGGGGGGKKGISCVFHRI